MGPEENNVIEISAEAKDMKKIFASPDDLKIDYAKYKDSLKKALKKINTLEGTEYIFLSNFQFDGEEKTHPVLFLGELNSQWKQAIRKDYKLLPTFSHGVCKIELVEGGAPILKLAYRGGKGSKDKNLKGFRKSSSFKNNFSGVLFEKLQEGVEEIDQEKSSLAIDNPTSDDKFSPEAMLILEKFKALQAQIPVLKPKLKSDPARTKKEFTKYISEVELSIKNWKEKIAEANKTDKELETVKNIETFLTKLKSQLQSIDVEKVGTSTSKYMMSAELTIIENEIAALRQLTGNQMDLLDDRKALLTNIQFQINQWQDTYLYDEKTHIHIIEEEKSKVAKYDTYINDAIEKLSEQEEILGLKELCRDFDDLKNRAETYLKTEANALSSELVSFFLVERFTVNEQFERWAVTNKESFGTDNFKKYETTHAEYKEKLNTLDTLLKNALKKLYPLNWDEKKVEEATAKQATGYTLEEGAELSSLTTLDKKKFKNWDDKLKKVLAEKIKILNKITHTDVEGNRCCLWEIDKELANYLAVYGNTLKSDQKIDIENYKKEILKNIKAISAIEVKDDVFEKIFAEYSIFLDLKNSSIEMNKICQDKLIPETEKIIAKDTILKNFSKITLLEKRFETLVESWNEKYKGVKRFDTKERSKDIRAKREEIFSFLNAQKNFYADLSDDNSKEINDYLQKNARKNLQTYNPDDDKIFDSMIKHYGLILELKKNESKGLLDKIIKPHEYNTKKLNKLESQASLWLFEARNLYEITPKLAERTKEIADYKKRLAPLSEYIDIKTKHFDLQAIEKEILIGMEAMKKDLGTIDNAIKELELENLTPEQRESVVLAAMGNFSLILPGNTIFGIGTVSPFKFYQKKYNQEILRLKKEPSFLLDEVDEASKYYLGLFKYLRDEVQRVKTQELQNTLSEIEQNKLKFDTAQQTFLKNEMERLAALPGHPLEQSLINFIKDVNGKFDSKGVDLKIKNKILKQCKEQIDQLALDINKEGNGPNKAALEASLKAEEQKLATLTAELEKQNTDISKIQKTIRDFWEALLNLKEENVEPILVEVRRMTDTSIYTFDLDKAIQNEFIARLTVKSSELKASLEALHNYSITHKKTMEGLLKYDTEDISFKPNEKIIERLYDGKQKNYENDLSKFLLEKAEMHKVVKNALWGKSVEELKKEGEKQIQALLSKITQWQNTTMPLMGENAKKHIKIIGEQAKDLKKFRFILLQAQTGDAISYNQKDINTYYKLIEDIGNLFKASKLDLVTLKKNIKSTQEQFYYYKNALFQSIEKAYQMDGEKFCKKMSWLNTIETTELAINQFIDDHCFDDMKKIFIDKKVAELKSIKANHATVLKTEFGKNNKEIPTIEQNEAIAECKTLAEVQVYWETKIQEFIDTEEYKSIINLKDQYQNELSKDLSMYRGASGVKVESLEQPVQDNINDVCARAQRLLELGHSKESQDMVRNIPAIFLSSKFVAAKRIFEEVDLILQGTTNSNQPLDDLGDSGKDLVKASSAAVNFEDIGGVFNLKTADDYKAQFKDKKVAVKNGRFVAVDGASAEDKKFVEEKNKQLEKDSNTEEQLATGAVAMSVIGLGLQIGFDVKEFGDLLGLLNAAKKQGKVGAHQQISKLLAVQVLRTGVDWANQAIALHDSLSDLAETAADTAATASEALSGSDIAKGVLTIVSTLLKFAATGIEAPRKNFWKTTIESAFDLAQGGAAVLSAFQVPGAAIVGDAFLIMKDIKDIIEKTATYRETKRVAHYIKVIQGVAETQESDYNDAMKGIRRQSKKDRKKAGINLASSVVDLGLDTIQLSGDIVSLTPAAPVGAGISLGAKIAKVIKTGAMLGLDAYEAYKTNEEHKEAKILLIRARSGDLDAISEIQENSVHYAKAFLICGVMDTAKANADGKTITLRKDNIGTAYLDQIGVDITEGKAQEIIRDHVGLIDIGMFTHRFDAYDKKFSKDWPGELAQAIRGDLSFLNATGTDLLSILEGDNGKTNISKLEMQIVTFLNKVDEAIKLFKEAQIYKNEHSIINFYDKHIGRDGNLTKVTNDVKSLLQAVKEVVENMAVKHLTEAIDVLNSKSPIDFEKHKLLISQRNKLEVLLGRLPAKALLKE